jgi:hypothetical protein
MHYFSTLCSTMADFFLLNSILMREGSRLLTKIIINVKKMELIINIRKLYVQKKDCNKIRTFGKIFYALG